MYVCKNSLRPMFQVLHEPLIDEDPVFIATCTERELRKRKKRKFSLWVRQCTSTGFICQVSAHNTETRRWETSFRITVVSGVIWEWKITLEEMKKKWLHVFVCFDSILICCFATSWQKSKICFIKYGIQKSRACLKLSKKGFHENIRGFDLR